MSQRIIDSSQKRALPPPQEQPSRSPREMLPTRYDLASEEVGESGLPDEFHVFQSQLLRETFQTQNYSPDEVFVGTDINLYFDEKHTKWYRRPDWFASVGVPRLYDKKDLRLSYVVWQEEVNPLVVVELLSPSTEKEDLGKTKKEDNVAPSKWQVYEKILRIPYYITFDRLTNKIQAFRLEGERYINFLPNYEQRYDIAGLEMSLGLWQGKYQEVDRLWLRWFDKEGCIIPTPLEKETKEKQAALEFAEQQRQEKEVLAKQLEAINEKLRALGIDPSTL